MNQLGHWLTSWEKAEIIKALIWHNLLKWDNVRQLPVKSGGKTDIYVNLRNARSRPEALRFLAQTFANPLIRLWPDRFVAVPDSVSCFADQLAIITDTPYIIIRERLKQTGSPRQKQSAILTSERVVIIDDVITDGASKIVPCRECVAMGLNVLPLIVLVDR